MPKHDAKAQLSEIKRLRARGMVGCTLELVRRYLAAHPKHGVVWLYYADALFDLARYKESLAALRRATALCPPDKLQLIYFRFGDVHRKRGALRLAERWYRRAVDSSPEDATYHIFLGALLASAGRLDEAEAVHRRATRCKVGCIDEAFLNRGFVLRALERYVDARKCFLQALKITPKYKEAREALLDVDHVIRLRRSA